MLAAVASNEFWRTRKALLSSPGGMLKPLFAAAVDNSSAVTVGLSG